MNFRGSGLHSGPMPSERSFARLPGFRDFVPGDLAVRNHIFKSWRRVSRRYGFAEYDGPPLESLDLYLKKSGSEIMDQLFNFEDKAGRHVTLRPEMTPTLARILAGLSRGMSKPIRWFSIPQLFRYERTQRGRLREHFQLNADIVAKREWRRTPRSWLPRSTRYAIWGLAAMTSWHGLMTAGS